MAFDQWLTPAAQFDHWLMPATQEMAFLSNEKISGIEVISDGRSIERVLLADLLSAPFVVEAPVGGTEGPLDRAQRELARLRDGWAGPGSLAPLTSVLADLSELLPILPTHADTPEFEVDSSDGTLTLVWNSDSRTFSAILVGNGKVVGVMSPSDGYKAWTLPIAKEVEIAEKFEDSRLSSFLGL